MVTGGQQMSEQGDVSGRRPDVIVVGAGPTGLMVAGDLARAGVQVTLVERRLEESNLTRAFAVHARTLELLDQRGLADALIKTGTPIDSLRLFGSSDLHLNGIPSRFSFVLITPQYNVERVLRERAEESGVEFVLGARVTELDQDDDSVTVTYEKDEGTHEIQASYVVGADGHRSSVRELLGLDFPGTAVVRSLILADVQLGNPPADVLTVSANEHGFCFIVPYGDGRFRVIGRDPLQDHPDTVPVGPDEVRALMRNVLGTDYGLHSPGDLSRFHSEERQVPRYRVGRVFLAGDAAHVHSPAGGQGMNTGLQDAVNLGWKIAAAVQGRGDEQLLDSYHEERWPVGRNVLRTSGGLVRLALIGDPGRRQARDLIARLLLSLPPLSRRLALMISGIGLRYAHRPGTHRRVGTRAADVCGVDGRRLAELLRSGDHVLIASSGFHPASLPSGVTRLPMANGVANALLVRPDGYVAWAGSDEQALDQELFGRGLRSMATL